MSKFLLPFTTLLLLSVLFPSPSTTKAVDDNLVVDTDGNPVESNARYYITSFFTQHGLAYHPKQIGTCPILNVILAPSANPLGSYKILRPKNSTQKYISIEHELQIFDQPVLSRPPLYCFQPSGWQIAYDRPTATVLVTLGGTEASSQFFKMVPVSIGEKIIAYVIEIKCPSGIDSFCGYLGYVPENGHKYLGMVQLPGLFVFKKGPPLDQYY